MTTSLVENVAAAAFESVVPRKTKNVQKKKSVLYSNRFGEWPGVPVVPSSFVKIYNILYQNSQILFSYLLPFVSFQNKVGTVKIFVLCVRARRANDLFCTRCDVGSRALAPCCLCLFGPANARFSVFVASNETTTLRLQLPNPLMHMRRATVTCRYRVE